MPLAPLHAPNAWSQAAPEQRLHTLRLDAPCISDAMPQKSAHAPAESRRPGLVQARRPYAVTEPLCGRIRIGCGNGVKLLRAHSNIKNIKHLYTAGIRPHRAV